jgi:DNA mismatch repair protein MutL
LFQNVPHFHVIGEALNTYIIVEYQNSVWMIDKHAAHERICFDDLRSSDYEPMPQVLISPIICRHGYDDVAILMENTELLERLGFYVEIFGEDALAVRQIPTEIDYYEAESALSDICAILKHGGTPSPVQLDEVYRAVACKASIKAGKSSDMRELTELAARVISGEVTECPHGRPVIFEITKATLDRGFKRT